MRCCRARSPRRGMDPARSRRSRAGASAVAASRTSTPSTRTRPLDRLVEPGYERCKRGLARSGASDERHRATGLEVEVDALEHWTSRARTRSRQPRRKRRPARRAAGVHGVGPRSPRARRGSRRSARPPRSHAAPARSTSRASAAGMTSIARSRLKAKKSPSESEPETTMRPATRRTAACARSGMKASSGT